jgi:adenine deaminase
MDASGYKSLMKNLIDVAYGRIPADMVIHAGQWVCVQSGEIIPDTDVAITAGHVAYVGPDAKYAIGPSTQIVEAKGRFLVPGFLDGHMHVESAMLTVTEYVRAVLPHGTTGMFIDPQEIANVMGMHGVNMMADEAAIQPIHIWLQMPSCVPPFPTLSLTDVGISPAEVTSALTRPEFIGLGEMMNFSGVILGDDKMLSEMAATRAAGKVISGHFASPDLGIPFHAYIAGGVEDDHEGTRLEDAVERVRQGMKPMLRQGSAWHDVVAQIKAITKLKLDPRHFILVTDDANSVTLTREGHMDYVVKLAIQEGVPPITAIQMATLNPAEHFHVSQDVGQIAPGRWADILIVSDLETLESDLVIAKGKLAAENGRLVMDLPSYSFPLEARHSVHIARPLVAADFKVPCPDSQALVNVIGIIENQAPTKHLTLTIESKEGFISADMGLDMAKVSLVDRHRATGIIQTAFVHGFGLQVPCAIASTVAHDSHQMLVVGTDDENMAAAVNELARVGGGQVVIREGCVTGLIELPIAGLMADDRVEKVAVKAAGVLEAMRLCGCILNNSNMQLSLLALVVIPELRISEMGLVDVTRFKVIPVAEQIA